MNYREVLFNKIKNNGNEILDDDDLFDFSKNFMECLKGYSIEDFKLYRYMPFNYNNLRSIETGKIYLSELGKMNDIFEGLTLYFPKEEINISDFHDLAYLKAFSEEKHNLLMWSHYANNHEGLCVEYDIKQLMDNGEGENIEGRKALYHLFPVIYSDTRIKNNSALYNIKNAAKKIEEYKYNLNQGNYYWDSDWYRDIKSLLLIKSKDWDYEKEWRIVLTFHQLKGDSDESIDPKIELYELNEQNVSFDCVSSIYCGTRLNQDKVCHIKEIVERINVRRKNQNRKNINLYKCSLNSDLYKIDEDSLI